MKRRFGFATVLIAVAALAAAGCGSSSSSKSAAAAPPPTTPPTPATPSTGTGTGTAPSTPGGNVMGGSGSASTPIGSPIVRAALIKKIAEQPSFPKDKDSPWADCVIKKLEADGIKTVGDAQQQQDKVKTAGADCAKTIVLGQK